VNKSELIDEVSAQAEISKAVAGKALDAAIITITNALKSGDMVTLVGFGTFYIGERSARSGRNPRTGDSIQIKAAKQPKFRAGKSLKDSVQ
jgi:DNA-binding protein HU-beta